MLGKENPLDSTDAADYRRSISPMLGPDGRVRPLIRAILFGIVTFFGSQLLLSVIVSPFLRGASLWWIIFWQSNALLVFGLAVSWFFLRVGDGKDFCALGLCARPGWLRQLPIGIALGIILQAGIVALLLATGALHYTGGTLHGTNAWLKFAGDIWLLAAAATFEEIAFRGYALQALTEAGGAAFAVVATSIVFGLAHIFNPAANFFSTINTVLAGVMLAIPYVRTRSMWMQSSLHWSWNFFMGPVFSLPVSGILFTPNIFSSHVAGAVWWSGGKYGPEGGAIGTLASLVAIAWLLRTRLLAPSTNAGEVLK
jgi:membrane protease YdiL (CAAX protease family)